MSEGAVRDGKRDVYIDGVWDQSTNPERVEVTNPATEQVIGTTTAGSVEDVDRAVAAARRAFDDWSAVDLEERTRLVGALADAIDRDQERLARLVTAEMGAPIRMSRWAQVSFAAMDLRGAVHGAHEVHWETTVGRSLVVREPIGVVGAITPWNYPLHQITAKIGAALVSGCTVVVKPSEVAPLAAAALVDLAEEVGFPPGVLNLVNGYGSVVGEAIAAHPDIDFVSFTGSNSVGKRVQEVAAVNVKRVALELGGKSASVVLADADLGGAVTHTVRSAFMNGGQSCNAQTRLVIHRSRVDEAEALLLEAVLAYSPGDPSVDSTRLGPLVTASQRERVLSYIRSGIEEGGRLLVGGDDRPEGCPVGHFVSPTVFSDVRPDMTIAREEIFGPVLSVIPVDSESEAVEVANDSIYGISGAVWSADADRAEAVARRLRTAQVELNGGQFNPLAPFGGYKQSGVGREGGVFGVEEYLEVKSLQR